jgi:uncharacterized protein (TIGR02246 family)
VENRTDPVPTLPRSFRSIEPEYTAMKRIARPCLFSILLAAVAVGCEPPEDPPATAGPDLAAEVDAIRSASEAWFTHFEAGEVDALVALYTPDAVILEPEYPPIAGTEAVRVHFAESFEFEPRFERFEVLEIEIATSGDLAWERGYATGTYTEDGEARTFAGPYLLVWKRTDGGWRIHREIYNDAPAS